MRDPRRNFFRHGLAVIASAGLVAAVVVWLPRLSYDDFHFCFRDVEGVEPGTKVLYRGYPIGTVAAIEPVIRDTQTRCGLDGHCFGVTLRLHRPWALTSDDHVEIVPSLVGGATLHVDVGGSSPEGTRDACPDRRRRSPVDRLPVVASKVEKLLRQINSQLSSSGNVSTILANLRHWSDPTDSKLALLLSDAGETNQKMQAIAATIERVTGRLERIVAGNEGSVGRSLSDLEYILDESSHSIGSMSVSLEGTAQNLLELTQELRTNPLFALTGRSSEDSKDPHVRAGP